MTPAGRRRVLLAAAAGAAAMGACSEVTTDPNTPVAIAFDSLPSPSIVVGDTLRDPETGAVVPLRATAFNSSGHEIPGAAFTFFPRDTGGALVIVGGDTLVAVERRESAATIIASLNGLQLPRSIFIVPRPDALRPVADSVRTFSVLIPDNAANVLSDSLRVRVVHDTTSADSLVRSWIVRFAVERVPAKLADSVRLLVGTTGAASAIDTSDASGMASRNLRIFAKSGTATGVVDTAVVTASATYKGVPLRGSPVRLVVPLTAAPTTAGP